MLTKFVAGCPSRHGAELGAISPALALELEQLGYSPVHEYALGVIAVEVERADQFELADLAGGSSLQPALENPEPPTTAAGRAEREDLLAVPAILHKNVRSSSPSQEIFFVGRVRAVQQQAFQVVGQCHAIPRGNGR